MWEQWGKTVFLYTCGVGELVPFCHSQDVIVSISTLEDLRAWDGRAQHAKSRFVTFIFRCRHAGDLLNFDEDWNLTKIAGWPQQPFGSLAGVIVSELKSYRERIVATSIMNLSSLIDRGERSRGQCTSEIRMANPH